MWSYYKYFLYGFMLLEKQGKLELDFNAGLATNISARLPGNNLFINSIHHILWELFKHLDKRRSFNNLKGFLKTDTGKTIYFAIDELDAPYLFSQEDLDNVDVYFKMQCPKNIDTPGFELIPGITIPWMTHEKDGNCRKLFSNFNEYKNKIFPLMIGPRNLAPGLSFDSLDAGFKRYLSSQKLKKFKKLMCYFGNARGPKPIVASKKNYDANNESHLMGKYIKFLHHPNEKRSIVANMIRNFSPKNLYDARIISQNESDSNNNKDNKNLIVPLNNFCEFIAQFQYNLNISGYKLSIPNRFIESFISDTAIVTDKLFVKWYKPFSKEVIQLPPMGYLPKDDINWGNIENQLKRLPDIPKGTVQKEFTRKWSPEIVAQYMIDILMTK